MATKLEPGSYDCFANALPDEPMFVLLARDPSAPGLVEVWAVQRAQAIERGAKPLADQDMVTEALACARLMHTWRNANHGKWRQPQPCSSWTAAEWEAEAMRLAHVLACVAYHATGGKLSKTAYDLSVYYEAIDERVEARCQEAVAEAKSEGE